MDLSPGTIAAVLTIGTILVAVASGVATHLLARRSASGRVGTSQADALWAEAQDMRHLLQDEKRRAEEQRDRLIESYTTQILPALASINQLVRDLSAVVVASLQEGRAHGASAPSPPP